MEIGQFKVTVPKIQEWNSTPYSNSNSSAPLPETPSTDNFYTNENGSQMIFWICEINGTSEKHVHEYDEYMIVVSGQYNIIFKDKKVKIKAGEEYFIPKGIHHAGEFIKGTRTIHAFGGKRSERK